MARARAQAAATATAIGPVTNGARTFIEMRVPYQVAVEITGNTDIIFHRWNCESIGIKGDGPKGSRIRKTDDLESYVYRDEDGWICLPGEYLLASIFHQARSLQDPRSPRKSMADLFKAGLISLTALASLGSKSWDYEYKHRVCVQRAGITRIRPAFKAGWRARFELQVVLPEYIPPDVLNATIADAGRFSGLAERRPTYGRYQITNFEPLTLDS